MPLGHVFIIKVFLVSRYTEVRALYRVTNTHGIDLF